MADGGAFPADFVWGAATAAHQIEGGNVNNDWWDFEHDPSSGCAEPSGDACDSWHRWSEDLGIVRELGLRAYRFSLEWSRIEPAPGEWSNAAVAHYRAIAEGCHERGIQPLVTLHHFTNPRWVAADGGWEDDRTVERFAEFSGRVTGELADLVPTVFTLNEPNAVTLMGWLLGEFVPGKQDLGLAVSVGERLRAAHRAAVDAIRSAAPDVRAGLTLSMQDWQAEPGGEETVAGLRGLMDDPWLDGTAGDDLLGVQTYTRLRMGPKGPLPAADGVPVTQLGYEFWPESLEACLRYAWDRTAGRLPLMVTENGIATDSDDQRIDYTRRALEGVLRCLADGLDVRGYLHWSLLDNFEWAHGYRPTFGLVAVDRTTFARTIKPSARWYADVVRSGHM